VAGEKGAYTSAEEGANSSCMWIAGVQLGPFIEQEQDTGIRYRWESMQMINLIPVWVYFFPLDLGNSSLKQRSWHFAFSRSELAQHSRAYLLLTKTNCLIFHPFIYCFQIAAHYCACVT